MEHSRRPTVKQLIAQCIALLVICLSAISAASATELGLITGGEGGTYYKFGLDLKRLVKADGINLTVLPSKGSVENIFAVSERPGVDMGIVQSDVLAFVGELPSNAALTHIAKSIRLVFPLYDEEVHVIGRQEIRSFDQLAGKRIAVGQQGSGTYLTATRLFKLSHIRPSESVPIEGLEALAQLKAGRIDAMVYVAAAPVQLLRNGVRAADGLALIPIVNKAVLESYAAAEIPANAYGWQPTPVSTVAVKAILVTFDFQGSECERIGRFAQQVASGMDWLTKNGHPKWSAIDLDYRLAGWQQHECVQKALGKSPPQESSPSASGRERNPVADAVKSILGND
jgi:TRAP transporter TAXI family solute receptor